MRRLAVALSVAATLAVAAPADAAPPDYPYVSAHCPGAVPGTDAGVTCKAHGWTVLRHATIGPNDWLRWTDGPRDCAVEDSPGPCYWDAHHRGNGTGQSFWRTVRGRVIPLR